MSSGIYKIANKITGDFYIGSAINYEVRISVHKNHLKHNKHHNPYLQRIFNKYGFENLSFELIEMVDSKKDLIKMEQKYLDELNPKYNIRTIADSNLGMKFSEETKQKISRSNKGRKQRKEEVDQKSIEYFFISPKGKQVKGLNLSKLCRKYNLSIGNMSEVLHGHRKQHKGWTKG